MPLSEEEQRILHEMEQRLYAQDKELVDKVTSSSVYKYAGKSTLLGVIGVLVGLTDLLVMLSKSIPLSFLGFVIMFGSALYIERNLKRIGNASWYDANKTLKNSGLPEAVNEMKNKFRGKFNRDL
jgi:hypothetical protein